MSSSQQTLEIQVMGQKIPVRSPSDFETAREAVQIASLKIQEAEARLKNPSAQNALLLALLDLSEEYVRSRQRYGEFRSQILKKTERLFELIQPESR